MNNINTINDDYDVNKKTLKKKYLTYLTLAESFYAMAGINTKSLEKYVEFRSIGLQLKKEYEEIYGKD